MKVTYVFDTASENFDVVEYNVVMNATKLSSILWEMDVDKFLEAYTKGVQHESSGN